MRIALPALVLFALLGSRIACASDDTVTSVPGGTIVRVVSIQTLSSATSRIGDAFVLYVSEDVTVDGKIVVRKGATGRGHVVGVDGARGNGHSGSLTLAFDYVFGVDGKSIALLGAPQQFVEEDRKGAASTATIAAYAAIGVTGLFAHNFAQGRQKVIDWTTPLTTFVAETVSVASAQSVP
jgi:hypothetical protein